MRRLDSMLLLRGGLLRRRGNAFGVLEMTGWEMRLAVWILARRSRSCFVMFWLDRRCIAARYHV